MGRLIPAGTGLGAYKQLGMVIEDTQPDQDSGSGRGEPRGMAAGADDI